MVAFFNTRKGEKQGNTARPAGSVYRAIERNGFFWRNRRKVVAVREPPFIRLPAGDDVRAPMSVDAVFRVCADVQARAARRRVVYGVQEF